MSIFLTTTSGSLIAIAFIGQASGMGQAFRIFSLPLLPTLLFLGIFTLGRVPESASEDGMYLSGINRFRHFYTEVLPELRDYFVLSTYDDGEGRMASAGIPWSRWQPMLAVPFMVLVIDAVLAGTLVGLLTRWIANWPLPIVILLGVLGRALLVAAGVRYQLGVIERHRHQIRSFRLLAREQSRSFRQARSYCSARPSDLTGNAMGPKTPESP